MRPRRSIRRLPAAAGTAMVTGPHLHNFKDIADRIYQRLPFFLLYITEGIPLGFAAVAVATT